MNSQRGRFITFEGGEGAGKSTQIKKLATFLEDLGIQVCQTREPGGCHSAELVRSLLVEGQKERWTPVSELLLMFTARTEHVHHVILPALNAGTWVLCDRFVDSSRAYQGYGHGLDLSFIEALKKQTVGDLEPDLTFILDVAPDIGLERTRQRISTEDRFESFEKNFHTRVRGGFLEIARQHPNRICVLDAQRPFEEIHVGLCEHVRQKFLKDYK